MSERDLFLFQEAVLEMDNLKDYPAILIADVRRSQLYGWD